MSAIFDSCFGLARSAVMVSDLPGLRAAGNSAIGRMRLSTESIGSFTLTLTNLVTGSAIQVETQTGTTIENRTAASSTEVFTVPTYAAGNAGNDLRVKVRKASSAPYYIPYQTLATAFVGSQSIYVSQIPDE